MGSTECFEEIPKTYKPRIWRRTRCRAPFYPNIFLFWRRSWGNRNFSVFALKITKSTFHWASTDWPAPNKSSRNPAKMIKKDSENTKIAFKMSPISFLTTFGGQTPKTKKSKISIFWPPHSRCPPTTEPASPDQILKKPLPKIENFSKWDLQNFLKKFQKHINPEFDVGHDAAFRFAQDFFLFWCLSWRRRRRRRRQSRLR